MDFKRLTAFFAIALVIMIGWEKMFPTPKPVPAPQQAAQQQAVTASAEAALAPATPITVTTDTVKAVIDEKSGDLRQMTLLKYKANGNENKPFSLFDDSKEYTYVAQSELLDAQGNKVYTFTKDSYLVNVRFDITNTSGKPANLSADYRIVRDHSQPEGQGYFTRSYLGPVVYTPEDKFQKVSFSDLDDDAKSGKNEAEYARKTQTGWLGMIEHHFMSTWILQPKGGQSVCTAGDCRIDIKRRNDNLYSTSVSVPLAAIQNGAKSEASINLYAGPQTTSVIANIADNLQLAKDYGKVHWFASPLFWLLNQLHNIIGNWGWAIVVLTIIVKAVLYPLTNASYRSMAKMRAAAPKLQAIKEKYGDDRMAQQQAMMQLYKDEKINPLGGCLPMLLQIPVFIGLYWALFASVELRQAPWLGWITDLSRSDPYYILPVIMAVTMFAQTFLNPPPTDPMQAKMMKIMPLVFSAMFFFFPAGLVLYWVVNNLLTITQQWHINRSIEKQRAQGEVVS